MAKLSSREKAAQKAGGTLNYKTGKITVPVKKPTVRVTSSKQSTPSNAIGQNKDGSYIYANGSSQNFTPANANYTSAKTGLPAYAPDPTIKSSSKSSSSSKSNSSSKSSSPKPSTVRSTAANFETGGFSAKGVENGKGITKTGRLLQILNDPFGKGGDFSLSQNIKDRVGLSGVDISGLLGVDDLLRTPVAEAADDPEKIANSNLFQLTGTAVKDIAGIGSPTTTDTPSPTQPNRTSGPVNYTPANFSPSSSGRRPSAVSNPYTTANQGIPATMLSSAVSREPDFTPIVQNQPGTQRQFLGNGALSNGAYNNGQGNYGVQGTLTGTQDSTSPIEDLLMSLVGSKAEAAGLPQASFDSFSPASSINSYQNTFGGLSNIQQQYAPKFSQQLNPTNTPPTPQASPQNPGGSQGGGVAQQYAQGTTGGDPLSNYYSQQQKGYSAQEKAQKRALNELLKSIKNQYKTQETQGTQKLDKSKQEDLLKLSGLFSFANQDPNSEQRVQYQNRLSQDYASQISEFLQQLSQQKGQAISQAKQGYQTQLADIADKKNTSSLEVLKLQEAARESAKKGGGGSAKAGSITYIGNDANGNPVYYNSTTGATQPYAGITRPNSNPLAGLFSMGGQQGGSWEIDPQTGEQVFVTN